MLRLTDLTAGRSLEWPALYCALRFEAPNASISAQTAHLTVQDHARKSTSRWSVSSNAPLSTNASNRRYIVLRWLGHCLLRKMRRRLCTRLHEAPTVKNMACTGTDISSSVVFILSVPTCSPYRLYSLRPVRLSLYVGNTQTSGTIPTVRYFMRRHAFTRKIRAKLR